MPPNLTLENVPGLSPNSQVDAISAVWFAQYGAVGKYKDQAGLLYHCLLANHEWDNTVDMESHPNEDEYLYNQMLAVTANSIPDDPEDGDYTAWRRTDEGRRAKYVFARRFVDAWDEMDNLNETAVEDVRETILYDDEAMILLDRRLEKQSDKIMTIGLVDKLAELHDLGMRLRWEEQESESEEPSSDSATDHESSEPEVQQQEDGAEQIRIPIRPGQSDHEHHAPEIQCEDSEEILGGWFIVRHDDMTVD